MLDIRLLGQFTLKNQGKQLNLASRRAQSLLAFLLLTSNIQHRREKLAGQLWPEADEEKARGRLRYCLWQLRGALGSQYIVADRISVSFNRDEEYRLDVAEFKLDHPERASASELKQALSFYQGELLPGFYNDWATLERRRLEALFEQQMQLLSQLLIAKESWREVVEWGERWIGLSQSSETAYRRIMIAYSQLGEISQAVSTYHRCVSTIDEQLDVEPSPRTKGIFDQISRGEKVDPAISENLIPRIRKEANQKVPDQAFTRIKYPPKKEEAPFVGRQKELEFLGQKLKLALDGEGQIVSLSGDAGRGKTSLMRKFCQQAQLHHSDFVVAYGSGEAQTGGGDPHLPFRDIMKLFTGDVESVWAEGKISALSAERLWELVPDSVEALLDHGPDLIDTFVAGDALLTRGKVFDQESATWLARLDSYLAKTQGRPIPLNVEHSNIQADLFEQYTRVVKRLSDRKPLVLVLDDFHWADTGSLGLLFHLARRIRGSRILLVVIYRADEVSQGRNGEQHPLEPILTELKRKFGRIEINLDQVDEDRGRALVDAIVDIEPNSLDDNFRRALNDHTGGHPLFTLELMKHFKEQGDLIKDDMDRWSESKEINWHYLPSKVEAVIESRINRLPADLRAILNAACIEGEEFSAEVIVSITGESLPKVIGSLSHGLNQQHVLVKASRVQQIGQNRFSRYRFRHHLFQKYLYDNLDNVERAFLHEQVGLNLEKLYGRQKNHITTRLAWHFENAGDPAKAVEYLFQAGEQAKALSANRQAINHFRKAIKLLEQIDDQSKRRRTELRLQIALGAPIVAVSGWSSPEAESAYGRAKELCERTGVYEQLAPALWGLWSYYLVRVKLSEAKKQADHLYALAKEKEEPSLWLVANWTLGITLAHLGELKLARHHLEQALLYYNQKQHESLTYLYGQNPGVTCSVYLAVVLWYMGFPDRSLEFSSQALKMAEAGSHLFSQAFAFGMVALLQADRREPEAALKYANLAIKIASDGQFSFMFGFGLLVRSWATVQLGKSKSASKLILRGLSAMNDTGAKLGRPLFLVLLAEALDIEGKSKEGLKAVQEALEITSLEGERLNEAELYKLKGRFLEKQNADISEIVACYGKAADIACQQGAKLLELRAQLAMARLELKSDEAAENRNQLARLYEHFSDGFNTVDLVEVRNFLDAG
ncbi:MAG: hypothetical protein BMS9Abin02_0726 [Anaerolineae bacterium]|nr:MAG: hypothetical protein BMS9Abin02_0726 [Anaerolineae bacterium]